ncbi:MAG: glutamine--tRNA ligase/YqeY domain fusion protein [Anaerolineae bacterium]|nr:glutamine--tRNA ligase/YqeY domain fusion protein [Anaerolineae bacterium]
MNNISVETESLDFLRAEIQADLESGRYNQVRTRFPPEPNGYLHIGHAKVVSIDFGIAEDFGGKCNLRFDDTNPAKENDEFVQAIMDDIHWLGYDWEDRLYFASDYFEQTYEYAEQLVRQGQAYVDDLSADEVREYRGTLTEPGTDSPYRNRSVEENLDLLRRMRAGEFPDGSRTLRAKIDMASPNLNMRDPIMYRIMHVPHYRHGDAWCIYPMYDWAHGLGDSIEGVTHSLCDVGYKDHRPLYDWFLDQLDIDHPRQIEFARYNVTYMVLSKRRLLQMVQEGYVNGWDDPRMPTVCGLRRRGYTPEAIRDFCERMGMSKASCVADIALLEHCIREDLNLRAPRALAVLRPLKVVMDNYPEGQVEYFDVDNHPLKPELGTRKVPFSREVYIEQEDFMEVPPRKYYRLSPGREVRLMNAYYITCTRVVKDTEGSILEIHCTYDPASRGGDTLDGRKVRGTLHWVSASHALDAELRLYDRLFTRENPYDVEEEETWLDSLNPNALEVLMGCKVEPGLAKTQPGNHYQFMRQGYFCTDPDSTIGHPVFNLTVPLRDSWAKVQNKT